jgi:hypothetical protein
LLYPNKRFTLSISRILLKFGKGDISAWSKEVLAQLQSDKTPTEQKLSYTFAADRVSVTKLPDLLHNCSEYVL